MPVVRNKSTEFGKDFWTHVESIADQVRSLEAQRSREGRDKSRGVAERAREGGADAHKTGTDNR